MGNFAPFYANSSWSLTSSIKKFILPSMEEEYNEYDFSKAIIRKGNKNIKVEMTPDSIVNSENLAPAKDLFFYKAGIELDEVIISDKSILGDLVPLIEERKEMKFEDWVNDEFGSGFKFTRETLLSELFIRITAHYRS